ncbi:MAG: type I 3-dehydroquinate dehydratase [Monoglobaceae bacterium]
MKVLSNLPSPILAGVVREKSAKAAAAEIKNCMYDGADMIDLHMSCLENTDINVLEGIINSSKLPVLALNYNKTYDWQNAGFSEEERAESFLRAVEAGAAGIDMQGYTFYPPSKDCFCGEDKYSFTKGNPKEIVTDRKIISKQCDFIEKIHSKGAEVLLSCHPGISMNCQQVVDLALFLEKRNPDIIKIVTIATNEEELLESFRTMATLKKEIKTKVSYHAAGKAGALSRIINPMLGGHMIFCVDRFNERSTMEQLDLKTTKIIIENMKKIR